MTRFKDKVVLITGAGSGFGLAAAKAFAAEGAQLALSDVNTDGIDLPGALVTTVDVSQEDQIADQVAAVTKQFGRLDIAVNNAGIGGTLSPIVKTPVEEFDQVMAVNARGVFLGMKHQLPAMMAAGSGAIVNISSASGILGAAGLGAYAASKHAVVGLTRAAADEAARFNVRVNAVCPSFADTPLYNALADEVAERQGITREEASQSITKRIPMRRVAKLEEVTTAILWAADPSNTFMTGQTIAIDGGLSAV